MDTKVPSLWLPWTIHFGVEWIGAGTKIVIIILKKLNVTQEEKEIREKNKSWYEY